MPSSADRFLVVRVEPLGGRGMTGPSDRADFEFRHATAEADRAEAHAGRALEGRTLRLGELASLGILTWESDRVARLDAATESYRLEMEPAPEG
jgi:hypothetical protein